MENKADAYSIMKDKNYNELKQLIEEHMESFELKELVGCGGESYVYKTLIKNVKRPFALKVIYNDKKHHKNSKEIDIAIKLKDNHVIKSFGMYQIKNDKFNCDCIVMEYSNLGNIRQFQQNFMKSNNMNESTLCYFASLILKGLKYCHMNKIAHYDIKPHNVIIDETLNLKLIDFSISVNYKDKSKIQLPRRGTKHYMAPEVINSEIINTKDLDKVDLYSLGSMLFNLAFGIYPDEFTEKELEEKINILIEENSSNYSIYFFDFVKKLLEKDINERINIKQAMEHYWIKGANILLDEKEKISNANIFLSYLLFDFFPNFNKYIYK
jgi:serine/threonine protein kinase